MSVCFVYGVSKDRAEKIVKVKSTCDCDLSSADFSVTVCFLLSNSAVSKLKMNGSVCLLPYKLRLFTSIVRGGNFIL